MHVLWPGLNLGPQNGIGVELNRIGQTAALESLQTKRSCMVSTMVTSVGKLTLTKFCMRKKNMTKSEPLINSIFDPTYSKVQCLSVSIFANC